MAFSAVGDLLVNPQGDLIICDYGDSHLIVLQVRIYEYPFKPTEQLYMDL